MRLLLVEDDSTYGDIERRSLERQGVDCHVVTSMTEAQAWLAKHEPDAVVLDLGLHDAGGMETLRLIVEATHVPVLVVTGSPEDEDRRELLRNGADDVLDKRDNVHLMLLDYVEDALARDEGRRGRDQSAPLRS